MSRQKREPISTTDAALLEMIGAFLCDDYISRNVWFAIGDVWSITFWQLLSGMWDITVSSKGCTERIRAPSLDVLSHVVGNLEARLQTEQAELARAEHSLGQLRQQLKYRLKEPKGQ